MDRSGEEAGLLIHLLREMVLRAHPDAAVGPVSPDTTLDGDLGFDSLARMELLVRMESRFGLSLPERAVWEAETVGDLLQALSLCRAGRTAAAAPAYLTTPAPFIEAPAQASTLVEVLEWHAGEHPDRVHLALYRERGDPDPLTYGQLLEESMAVAGGLKDRDLQPGQPVGLMLPTCRDYFASFFGILLAGGVPVPLYPPQRKDRLEEHARRQAGILRNAQARLLIAGDDVLPFGRLLSSLCPDLDGVTTAAALREAGAAGAPVSPRADDIALLQYTSGSTGDPKGVVLSHRHILANIRAIAAAAGLTSADVCVSWLPLTHDMGLIGAWLGSFYTGMRLAIMPPEMFLMRPARWLRAIQRERGTASAAPNFAYELCASRIGPSDLKGLDLSSWRLALNGSEAVSAGTLDRFCRRFGASGFRRESFLPVYGLAECTLGLAFPPPGREPLVQQVDRAALYGRGQAVPAAGPVDPRAAAIVSCGPPLPGYEVRVVNDLGREAAERRVGRLEFRGPSATDGYFRNPQATRRLFHKGWLDSGDLAYLSEGEVFITGRAKDVIIKGGRNIHPAELEKAVERIPGVRLGSVAAIGVPNPEGGTEHLVVAAEAVARDPTTRESILRSVREAVVEIVDFPPDDVVLIPPHSMPKTPSGKIRRSACLQLYLDGSLGFAPRSLFRQRLSLAFAAVPPLVSRWVRRAASALYAAYGWLVFSVLAALAGPAVMLLPSSLRWAAVRRLCRIFFPAVGLPLRVEGASLLPSRGPCVVAVNHASYLDVLVLSAVLPPGVRFTAKNEFLRNPVLHPLFRRLGTLFVDRFEPQAGARDTAAAAEAVRGGATVVVFPEGTFRREPGLRPFRLGGFLAAARAEAPVVPITLRGTRHILRAGQWYPRRGRIEVIVGAPLRAAGPDWADALDLSVRVRRQILSRVGEPDRSGLSQSKELIPVAT